MRYWLLFSCCFSIYFISANSFLPVKSITAVTGRPNLSIGFLLKRTVSINQKACSCSNASSCSCCQSVTILLRGVARNFCVNFTYANTGLSMSILLGSKTIRYVSVIDYRAFKVCTPIPDCQHSFACVDVVELSLFPKSVTICMQLDITSKNMNWLINYNCMSVSTLLVNQSNTATTTLQPTTTNIVLNMSMGMNGMQPMGFPGPGQMMPGQMPGNGQMPPGQMPGNGQMPPGQMPGNGQMMPGQFPGNGQMPPGQMPGNGQMMPGQFPGPGQMPGNGQMMPGQMPGNGQMMPGQMPGNGQMPPGQMPGNGQMPPGQMPGNGQMMPGQFPGNGQMPPGQMPGNGQMMPGQFPGNGQMMPGQMPGNGQMMPGQMPGNGQGPPGQMPGNGQMMPGQMPGNGQMMPGQFPGNGQMMPGQMPGNGQGRPGQMPGNGQMMPGQMPGNGQMPPGQTPGNGQMPPGQVPGNGQGPPGQMPSGQMPPGQVPGNGQGPPGQMPSGQMPPGQVPGNGQGPPGQMPSGQMPPGQVPGNGQGPPGQMPSGQMPPGQLPPGQFPPGKFSPGQMPPGLIPSGQMQQMLGGRIGKPISRSARGVPEFLNWVLSRKSGMIPGFRTINSSSNTQGWKPGRNTGSLNILSINAISNDSQQEDARVLDLEDGEIRAAYSSTAIKIEFRNNFDKRKSIIPKNDLNPIKLLNHRAKRNIVHKQSNSPMRMQVILRGRKTRIPKMVIGNELMKGFRTWANYPASRSPRIVNQDTISIPMSQLGLGNVMVPNASSSNNAFKPLNNGSRVASVSPGPLPASPPNAIPVLPPVLVWEDTPSIDKPIAPEFFINYDNRTSSFPDRMPPSFGMASRIGPNGVNKSIPPFERDVEELETVGPEIALHPNSKIVGISDTDLTDGRIIFPE